MAEAPPEAVVLNLQKRFSNLPREVILEELQKVGNHFGLATSNLKQVAKTYRQWGGVAHSNSNNNRNSNSNSNSSDTASTTSVDGHAAASTSFSSSSSLVAGGSGAQQQAGCTIEPQRRLEDSIHSGPVLSAEERKIVKVREFVSAELQKRKKDRSYSLQVLQRELEEQVLRGIECGVPPTSQSVVEARATLSKIVDLLSPADEASELEHQAARGSHKKSASLDVVGRGSWSDIPDAPKPNSRLAKMQAKWARQEAEIAKRNQPNEWKGLAAGTYARKHHRELKGIIEKNHEVVQQQRRAYIRAQTAESDERGFSTLDERNNQAEASGVDDQGEQGNSPKLALVGGIASLLMKARARLQRLQDKNTRTGQLLEQPVDTTGLNSIFESQQARFKWAVADENARWQDIVKRFEKKTDRDREEALLRRYKRHVDEEEVALERAYKMRQQSRTRKTDNLFIRLALLIRQEHAAFATLKERQSELNNIRMERSVLLSREQFTPEAAAEFQERDAVASAKSKDAIEKHAVVKEKIATIRAKLSDLKNEAATDEPGDPIRSCIVSGRIPVEFRFLLVGSLYQAGLVSAAVVQDLKQVVAEDRSARVAALQADNNRANTTLERAAVLSQAKAAEQDTLSVTDDSTAVVTATTTSSASKMPDTLTPDIQQVSGSNKDSTGYGAEFFTSKQLFEATWENRVDEVKLILQNATKYGIDLNATNKFGYTALHWATQRGHYEIVKAMVACHSVDSTLGQAWGMSPLAIARKNGHSQIAELLSKGQARRRVRTRNLPSIRANRFKQAYTKQAPVLSLRGEDVDKRIISDLRRKLQVACKKIKQRDPTTKARSSVAQAFRKWDKTGTGRYTFTLFSHLVRQELLIMPANISDQKLQTVFTCIDLDGSGTIELEEFLEFLSGKDEAAREMASVTEFACALCREHLRRSIKASTTGLRLLFNAHDHNHDAELSWSAFLTLCRKDLGIGRDQVPDAVLEGVFRSIDADEGGTISFDEMVNFVETVDKDISRFRTLLWSAQHKLQSRSGMNIRDLFVKADIDGNGELDFEEFCEVIRVDLRLGMDSLSNADLSKLFIHMAGTLHEHISGSVFMTFLELDSERMQLKK